MGKANLQDKCTAFAKAIFKMFLFKILWNLSRKLAFLSKSYENLGEIVKIPI